MIKKLTIATLALSLILALPGVAFAQTTEDTSQTTATTQLTDEQRADRIDAIKERAQKAIDRRIETIGRLRAVLNDHRHVTSRHKADLIVDLNEAEAGLRTLSREIDAATSFEQLRVLVTKIATDFRIYLVVAPKVHEVIAGDTMVWAVDEPLTDLQARIGDAIERAKDAGYDTTEAERYLGEMDEHMDAARSLAAPVPGSVIDLDAGDWPDPARSLLEQGRDDLKGAHDQIRDAARSAHAAVQALRELFPSDTDA